MDRMAWDRGTHSQMMKLCDARSLWSVERVEAWIAAASGSLYVKTFSSQLKGVSRPTRARRA